MKTISTPNYPQHLFGHKSWSTRFRTCSALATALAILAGPSITRAQSDNFDSYSTEADMKAGGWLLSTINGLPLSSTTFPAVGTGKGMRLQANPVPGAAPAAGLWYRTNEYTDFYVSVDLADWPGTDKNQAMVLFGRMTDSASGGTVTTTMNPASIQGMICNYDASQYGENPGNRRQGQFQINRVSPGFGTLTHAVSEITLIPGRSYRITFKGVGTVLTAQVYDLFDLTKPLVTLEATDDTYTSGACGILGFSRQSTAGTADATFDNYRAGVTDPNVAPAPALAHPIAGTPQVVTRTPASRFANFHPAASEIGFTVDTFAADLIDTAATKLYLNGVDASAALAPLPANAASANFATVAGTLTENTIYSAQIEVQDVSGTKKSTNTFWFDTFTDAYLATPPVKTVEVEDYNYTITIDGTNSSGRYQIDPIPVSGFDTNGSQVNGLTNEVQLGYLDVLGTDGVDFEDNRTSPEGAFNLYRIGDFVGTVQGPIEVLDVLHTGQPPTWDDGGINRANDNTRQKYSALGLREYQVVRTEVGEWLNYTRIFLDTNYYVYLRVGSFGASTVNLDRVTSDPTVTNQTTSPLGTFSVPNQIMHGHYRYQPLMSNGAPAVVNLAGTNTIRLTMGGTVGEDSRKLCMNYLLFVPVPPAPPVGPTVFDNFNDGNDTANPAWDHFDPIGGLTAAPAAFTFPNGGYRIVAPTPAVPDAGPARAGSFLRGAEYSDFYVAVDVIDFDDTVRQAFGIAARIRNAGLGTTDGYLFSWEPGSGTLPGTNNGDLDISRLVGETPIGQIETNASGFHLERGKSYRFAFAGKGPHFVAEVYELPHGGEPLIRIYGFDPENLYPSGSVGLITADQGSGALNPGDATFDNFLATTAEPRLTVTASGANVTLSWPDIPFRLVNSPSLSTPVWTEVTTGITDAGDRKVHTISASDSKYYRLVYP